MFEKFRKSDVREQTLGCGVLCFPDFNENSIELQLDSSLVFFFFFFLVTKQKATYTKDFLGGKSGPKSPD
jgi:hypothetical protein